MYIGYTSIIYCLIAFVVCILAFVTSLNLHSDYSTILCNCGMSRVTTTRHTMRIPRHLSGCHSRIFEQMHLRDSTGFPILFHRMPRQRHWRVVIHHLELYVAIRIFRWNSHASITLGIILFFHSHRGKIQNGEQYGSSTDKMAISRVAPYILRTELCSLGVQNSWLSHQSGVSVKVTV
eukprot:COSAG02_NODE_2383_length_8991_cov_40.938934_2_plen_178_part_00